MTKKQKQLKDLFVDAAEKADMTFERARKHVIYDAFYCCTCIRFSKFERRFDALRAFTEYFKPEWADDDQPWWSTYWNLTAKNPEDRVANNARVIALLLMAEMAKSGDL